MPFTSFNKVTILQDMKLFVRLVPVGSEVWEVSLLIGQDTSLTRMGSVLANRNGY